MHKLFNVFRKQFDRNEHRDVCTAGENDSVLHSVKKKRGEGQFIKIEIG